MHKLEDARRQMIEQQVRAWQVLDPRVLQALAAVRRERFVPEEYRDVAFADTAIPLAQGQCMLTPTIEGRILQALAVERGEEALEVGTGSGFFAACLAQLGATVRSLELYGGLAESASRALRDAGVVNVTVEQADALHVADELRYDVIALTASLPVYDARFERALRPGGRLFVAVGTTPAMQAMRVTRTGTDEWLRTPLFETVIPALVGAATPPRFEF